MIRLNGECDIYSQHRKQFTDRDVGSRKHTFSWGKIWHQWHKDTSSRQCCRCVLLSGLSECSQSESAQVWPTNQSRQIICLIKLDPSCSSHKNLFKKYFLKGLNHTTGKHGKIAKVLSLNFHFWIYFSDSLYFNLTYKFRKISKIGAGWRNLCND